MSIFDTYRTEAELEVVSHEHGEPLTVSIAKVGGGTVGRAYDGSWLVEVTNEEGETLLSTDDLCTGMPKTHEQAAIIALDFIADEEF